MRYADTPRYGARFALPPLLRHFATIFTPFFAYFAAAAIRYAADVAALHDARCFIRCCYARYC